MTRTKSINTLEQTHWAVDKHTTQVLAGDLSGGGRKSLRQREKGTWVCFTGRMKVGLLQRGDSVHGF